MYCSMSVTIDAIVDIKRNEIFLFFYIYLSKKDDIITIVFISMIFIMSSSFATSANFKASSSDTAMFPEVLVSPTAVIVALYRSC